MRYPLYLILLALLGLGCSQSTFTESSLNQFIPRDAQIVLQVQNLANFKSNLRNCEYLAQSEIHPLLSLGNSDSSLLRYVESDSIALISMVHRSNKDVLLLVTTETSPASIADSTSLTQTDPYTLGEITMRRHQRDNLEWYSATRDGFRLWSKEPDIIKEVVQQEPRFDPELDRLLKAANNRSSASLFRRGTATAFTHFFPISKEGFLSDSLQLRWQAMDLELRQSGITGSGVEVSPDSSLSWASQYRGSNPLENRLAALAPLQSDALISYTVDHSNRPSVIQDSIAVAEAILNSTETVGVILLGKQKWVVLNLFDATEMEIFLEQAKQSSRQYQGSEIIQIGGNSILQPLVSPIIRDFKAGFVTRLENQFIFTESVSALELLLQDYNKGTVFSGSAVYESTGEFRSQEASFQFVANSKGMQALLREPVFEDHPENGISLFPEGYGYSGQLVGGNDYLLNNLAINRLVKKVESNTTNEVFRLQLDGEVATTPQFVINHRNRKKEIVVQDDNNQLYLISGAGKVLWKKQLDSRIQGEIKQVDLYKNGRLQLAFTTNKQFLILDRNGKEVAPFSMEFKGGNLNPLSVFDYEGNRNYRFVVTQGSKIYMYNRRGQIVKGFTYTETAAPVLRAPQHFRIGSKDYLVFQLENGALEIRNRVGKTRITVSDRFDFSDNKVYLYRNQFTFTDNTGRLYSINTKGKLTASKLNLDPMHRIDATSKTLATLTENTLTIKGKPITLDLGVYANPKIFYLYDKIYVSVTDLQGQKVYLFDSQTEGIPGFPVFGVSSIALDDVEGDRILELVTKGQNADLVLYQLN